MRTPRFLPIVAWALGLALAAGAPGQTLGQTDTDGAGWGPGGRYARLFDPSTVETVMGDIIRIERVTPIAGMSPGVHCLLETDGGPLSVHLGPARFVEAQDLPLLPGRRARVTGSRVQLDGAPVLIASTIAIEDRILTLRDETGVPVWSAPGRASMTQAPGRRPTGPVRAPAGRLVDPRAETRFAFSIVEPQWVFEHCLDEDLRILDVREDDRTYLAGHVPGAVHFAASGLRGPDRGMPAQYLPEGLTAELLARAGVSSDTDVVLYGDGDEVVGVTMVAYALERLGFDRKVMLMNGGFAAYAEGFRITREFPTYEPGYLRTAPGHATGVTLGEVEKLIARDDVVVIDARSSAAYRGEADTWIRNGHVPGAINVDWHELVSPENAHALKAPDEIKALLAARGVNPDEEVIVMCGTGRKATLPYMYLKHVLGFPHVRLYEGSWTEWSAEPEQPVETAAR